MGLVKYNNNSISAITTAGQLASGSMVLIKEQTASSSSTISFVDGSGGVVLDSTYPIYKFEFINIHPSADIGSEMQFQGSTDGGSNYNTTMTTTAFYTSHNEGDTSTQFSYYATKDQAQGTGFQPLSLYDTGNDNDQSGVGELFLFGISSTTFVKHFMSHYGGTSRSDYRNSGFVAGYFNTVSTMNAFQFKMNTGNIDSGTIKLYGIKDS